jgi:hypothetical protein
VTGANNNQLIKKLKTSMFLDITPYIVRKLTFVLEQNGFSTFNVRAGKEHEAIIELVACFMFISVLRVRVIL